MNTDKLIKELELLADSCDSNYALEVNGYSQGVNDAIDLVKKLTIPVVINCLSCGKNHAEICGGCVSDIAQATGEQAIQSR